MYYTYQRIYIFVKHYSNVLMATDGNNLKDLYYSVSSLKFLCRMLAIHMHRNIVILISYLTI